MRQSRILTLALTLFTIGLAINGCGFTPVYGTKSGGAGQKSVSSALNSVAINPVPDREGQYLRNALIDRFYVSGTPADPAYELNIDPVQERRIELDITETADTTRAQLRLRTQITLTRLEEGERRGRVVLSRDLTAITSYNVLSSQFTTRVSEENARDNGLEELARQIERQLSLYFTRQDG